MFWYDLASSLLIGIINTLELLLISAPLGTGLGIAVGILSSRKGFLSILARAFSSIFRGFPLLVTLFIVFFGLADFGIYLSPTASAIISFILCSSAYISEYVRGAILSIDEGQSLAAKAIGMNETQEFLHIIIPQAIRRALPSISNEIVYMVQYSSLAFAIGVQEIYSVAKSFNSLYFRPLEIFSTLAFIYLSMTALVTLLFRKLTERLRIPD